MIIKCIKSNSLRMMLLRRWQLQRAGIGIALERMGNLPFAQGGDRCVWRRCGGGWSAWSWHFGW